MTPLMLTLIELVAKIGLDAAIVVLTNLKNVSTIDDAIAALEVAKSKTAQQYLDEAKAAAAAAGTPPVPAPAPVPTPATPPPAPTP